MDNYSGQQFYNEVLCEHADRCFQFAYGLSIDRSQSLLLVQGVYQDLSIDLPLPSDYFLSIVPILKGIWDKAAGLTLDKNPQQVHSLFINVFNKLTIRQRAVLVLCDHLGFKKNDCLRVISGEDDVNYNLGIARKILVESSF